MDLKVVPSYFEFFPQSFDALPEVFAGFVDELQTDPIVFHAAYNHFDGRSWMGFHISWVQQRESQFGTGFNFGIFQVDEDAPFGNVTRDAA